MWRLCHHVCCVITLQVQPSLLSSLIGTPTTATGETAASGPTPIDLSRDASPSSETPVTRPPQQLSGTQPTAAATPTLPSAAAVNFPALVPASAFADRCAPALVLGAKFTGRCVEVVCVAGLLLIRRLIRHDGSRTLLFVPPPLQLLCQHPPEPLAPSMSSVLAQ